ncbi:MAG: hypothetical protein AAF288_03700 [Planctomycetota bacterium]
MPDPASQPASSPEPGPLSEVAAPAAQAPHAAPSAKAGRVYTRETLDLAPDEILTLGDDDRLENCTIRYGGVIVRGDRVAVRRVRFEGARETKPHYRGALDFRHCVGGSFHDIVFDHTSRGVVLSAQGSKTARIEDCAFGDLRGVGGWHPDNGAEFFLIEESYGPVRNLSIANLITTGWWGPTFQAWAPGGVDFGNIRVRNVRADNGAVVLRGPRVSGVSVTGVHLDKGYVAIGGGALGNYVEGAIGHRPSPFDGVRNQTPDGLVNRWREFIAPAGLAVDPGNHVEMRLGWADHRMPGGVVRDVDEHERMAVTYVSRDMDWRPGPGEAVDPGFSAWR